MGGDGREDEDVERCCVIIYNNVRAMRVCSIISLLLLAVSLLMSCGADTYEKKGDKSYALGEYFDAAAFYKRAYSSTPSKERALRGKRAAKMADCYRRINYTTRAISAYQNVIRYNKADSLTHLRLAMLQMKNGQYREAEKTFAVAVDSLKNSMLARNGLKAAKTAPAIKAQGSKYSVKREAIFNSRRADYSPVLVGDRLYITSTRNEATGDELSGITGTKNADIFVAEKDERGKWEKPKVIDSELNTPDDEGACTVSDDGRTMYITQCTTDPNYPRFATIARSSRNDASWGKAQMLKFSTDTLSSYAHPALSPDGEWLYFTSDMPGGMGGLDIWRIRVSQLDFGGVENLGAPINTEGDEEFPTFRPNGDLYFSSNGHPGLGGLDIFIAHTDSATKKITIEHPGYPLNSNGDDFGMTFDGVHNRGYFASNRGDARGWDHIYSFDYPEVHQTVKGWVYEKDGYELPAAQVYMVGSDGTNQRFSVKGDGSFTSEVKPGVEYVLLGTCKGYLNHKEQLAVADTATNESHEYVLQFPLASITAPVLIDNIFYEFDKATLTPESTTSLDELVTLLNENPNVTIELSAHCDYRGSDAYNQSLSQRRAESVVNYLLKKGIAKDRLTPVGYGKSKPKTIKKKLTEKYPFLKEGDKLSPEFISTLKPVEQEIGNQLNRRTEFIVLRTTYGMF